VGYRTVFNMYVIDGYTHKEISTYLNISEGTSKSQLSKARKLLRTMLEQQLSH
ncbi:MAG: sigma factor-like helix-turn-helix DNA-binding protein, partial [Bacteroidota bacterium]